MRIFFDTEFMEDGRTIELLSIGMVREDGQHFYAESAEADHSHANQWVREHVLPHLKGESVQLPRAAIAEAVVKFVGEKPQFWAYYGAYDWVVLCQLYGRMIDLPKGWPMFCMDVKQLAVSVGDPPLPKMVGRAHNALDDAAWCMQAFIYLTAPSRAKR